MRRPKAANKLKNQDFDAFGEDPMKHAKVKGSNIVSEAGFCCLRRRPDETREEQRQQTSSKIKILLPPAKRPRNLPGPKAAKVPQNQEFAATAEDQMNQTKENQIQPHHRFLQYAFTAPDFFVILEKDPQICELKKKRPRRRKQVGHRIIEDYE